MRFNSSGYIHKNKLCMLGVCETALGVIPFCVRVRINGERVENAPLNPFSKYSPNVRRAIQKTQEQVMHTVKKDAVRLAAENLVERARQGDQVAMSMIVMVRNAASKGAKQARIAYDIMRIYIKDNPAVSGDKEGLPPKQTTNLLDVFEKAIKARNPAHFSAAVKGLLPSVAGRGTEQSIITIANGPNLLSKRGQLNSRIRAMFDSFTSDEERRAFEYGIQNSGNSTKIISAVQKNNPLVAKVIQLGQTIGLAKRVQAVRKDGVPISVLSSSAAWELGE